MEYSIFITTPSDVRYDRKMEFHRKWTKLFFYCPPSLIMHTNKSQHFSSRKRIQQFHVNITDVKRANENSFLTTIHVFSSNKIVISIPALVQEIQIRIFSFGSKYLFGVNNSWPFEDDQLWIKKKGCACLVIVESLKIWLKPLVKRKHLCLIQHTISLN